MQATHKFTPSLRLLFLGLTLTILPSQSLAEYKVVLKDGRVLEARAKPISMEGHLRFTDSKSQFQSIPIQLVDLAATQTLNAQNAPTSAPARVLTNEDLTSGNQPSTKTAIKLIPASSPDAKKSKTSAAPSRGEAYWRGRARQIRDEMENVDKQIKALNVKPQPGKGDGIKIGFETYNSVIYADFESQVKELERRKEKLQTMMTALEEEARKGGALPGWLR